MDKSIKTKMEKMETRHFDEISSFLADVGLSGEKTNPQIKKKDTKTAKKILLVDDNDSIRELIKSILQEDNVHILECGNGKEAMKLFGAHPNIELILIDLQMPEMNGFQFLQLAKSLRAIDDIPVMIITAHTNQKTLALALKFKVKDFIVKPFEPESIRQKVLHCLNIQAK